MEEYFCFSVNTGAWGAIGFVLLVLCLLYMLEKVIPGKLYFFIGPLILASGFFGHYGSVEYAKYSNLKHGLSAFLQRKDFHIESIQNGCMGCEKAVVVQVGNSINVYPISCITMENNLEYTVYTTPSCSIDFAWCVEKEASSRAEFVEIIRENGSFSGNISCGKLVSHGCDIYSIPCGEHQTAVAFSFDWCDSRVALLSNENVEKLIDLVKQGCCWRNGADQSSKK